MGNCMRCGKKEESAEFGSGKKPRKPKEKTDQYLKTADGKKDAVHEKNGKAIGHVNSHGDIEEHIKVVKIIPLEDTKVYASREPSAGPPQERKVLRLVLPYIPKKEWGKLRQVCRTWCSVVDGEWGRMHALHLPELLPGNDSRNAAEKRLQLADHIGSNCQLSRSIVCTPGPDVRGREGAVDLSDEQFWRRLLPRTQDLTTLRLQQVHLPKYFFTDFLPRCKKLEVLEIEEAQEASLNGGSDQWTQYDKENLRTAIAGMDKLNNVRLSMSGPRLPPEGLKFPTWFPASRDINHSKTNDRLKDTKRPVDKPFPNRGVIETSDTVPYDCGPLTASSLKALSGNTRLTSLSLDLDLTQSRFDWSYELRSCFSSLKHLRELRINIITNENNVYPTLQTLSLILDTVAESARELTTLKLMRLPDPMGIDKPLATAFTTALVKLNDETQLRDFHVCVLAAQELFHVWSLPWPALTRLRRLTVTDCNLYPQRPREIDLEPMPALSALILRTDSLDDNMVMRVFAKTHSGLTQVTIEPGPKGIGRRGMRTIAIACQTLQHFTLSYSRTNKPMAKEMEYDENAMDFDGWAAFFRLAADSLQTVDLIDIDRQYMDESVAPVASAYRHINVRPIYGNAFRSGSAGYRS